MSDYLPQADTPLSETFGSQFDARTKQRGRDYFAAGAVRVSMNTNTMVLAEVWGSKREPYLVEISWSPDFGSYEVVCDCPRFEDGYECKHIWATMLASDEKNGLLTRLNYEAADTDDIGMSRSKSERHIWQRQLSMLNDGSISPLAAEGQARASSTARKESYVWYVIDVGGSLHAGRLMLRAYLQERKKNGELGKLRAGKLRRGNVKNFSDPRDRKVLPFLFDKLVDFETSYGYFRNDWQTLSNCLLNAGSSELLLPMLAETGRLAWALNTELPPEEAMPIAWDSGDPWQFRPLIVADEQAEAWHVRGELFRGDTSVPLEDAVLVMDDGIVLFTDSAARCDLSDGALWLSAIRQHTEITIPFADRSAFLSSLASWQQPPSMQLPANLSIEQHVGTPRGRLLIMKPEWQNESRLYAEVSFSYAEDDASVVPRAFEVSFGDVMPGWYDADNDRTLLRDRAAEVALVEQLDAFGIQDTVRSDHQRGDVKFLRTRFAKVVQQLVDANWRVESEDSPIRIAGNFSLSVKTDIDWFELDGSVEFDGESVTLPSLLAAIQSGQRFITLGDGSMGMLPTEWLKKFGSLATLAETKEDTLRFAPTQTLLLDVLLAEQDQEQVHLDADFVRQRDKLRGFGGVKGRTAPRGFHGELREYQQVGLGWMQFLRDFRFGGCLADDMGLGKTVQVLAMLQGRRFGKKSERRPSLVVVPKSLVFNWIDEAEKFTPNLRVLNYTGLSRKDELDNLTDWDLVVTTYGTLRRDIVDLKSVQFDYAILDESQAIKNHNSQAAKACRLLQSRYRLAMTGTPIENHLGELW